MAADLLDHLVELLGDLVALEPGEALEPQLEDRLRLLLGKAIDRRLAEDAVLDQRDERRDRRRRPVARHEPGARRRRIGGGADERDHLVDVGDRDGERDQRVRPLPRLAQEKGGAPRHHLLAEGDEGGDDVLEAQQLRPARH